MLFGIAFEVAASQTLLSLEILAFASSRLAGKVPMTTRRYIHTEDERTTNDSADGHERKEENHLTFNRCACACSSAVSSLASPC
jgi:hypothetical protein